MDDWPAQIQDVVFAAVEKLSREVELPLAITHSYCDKDLDSADPKKTWFVRIFLSEIVASIDIDEAIRQDIEARKLH